MVARARITVFDGTRDTVLCDWTDQILGAVDIQPTSEIQVARYFRGEKAKVFDRGNVLYVARFTVMHEWERLEDARAWRYDAKKTVPRSGKVTISERGYNAAAFFTRIMADAVIQVLPQRNNGVTTLTQYTVTGGSLE